MAFFGEDGLQRQLKQAQKDIMAKDREIGTMHLSAKEKDEALKKLRQEIERLQEEKMDMAGGAGPSQNHDHHLEENHRLKTQIRDLQNAMSKLQMDGNRLREEARQTSVQLNEARLRKISGSSSSSSNTLASPASSRSSRRRSTSLSDSRVMDLEAEISVLRQNAGSPVEIDSLKTQIANARRELNKAINEKITVESKARKDVDAVKSLLEDANYELEGLRRELEDGGDGTKKELEKKQKMWESERSELAGQVKGLEALVATGKAELAELRSTASEAERLKEELDQARSLLAATPTPDHSGEVNRLTQEVASLQAELTRAQSHTPTSTTSSTDLTIRRLERKLEKAQRDTEALEESLDKAEEENQALRSHIPLPGSPGVKAEDGRIVELETDNERLQGEVAQLQAQIRSVREELDHLQAAGAKAEQAEKDLQEIQDSLQSKEAEWNVERMALTEQQSDLKEKVSVAEANLASKARDVETKEAEISTLSASLATSESQVQDLGRQLEEAAANPRVSQLEDDVSALKSTIGTLTKDKEEAARSSTDLHTQLESLTRDLSSSREDLQMDRAELEVLRVQLAQASTKEAAAQTEIDTLQDQLHVAMRQKTGIEDELNELRTSLVDRSTESEAESKNGELLILKSELDQARQELQDKERELEQEIQGLKFVKEKDDEAADKKINALQEELTLAQQSLRDVESRLEAKITELEAELQVSQTRVQTLEGELATIKAEATTPKVTPISTTPDRLGLLYSKIQSLRAERDDLRQSLSFAQNESRFTIRAAQADRESAIGELEAVKSDLNKQLAVHESLEQEVSSVRTQLDEKEIKLEDIKNMYATATVDEGDVADKIAQYESEVVSAKTERDHLVQELGESHRQIMELNHAMAMMRTSTGPEQRMRKISMERKVPEMPKITETSSGVAVDRGPISLSSSRRPGHSRTKSEIASLVLPDQAQITGLTAQVSELESQIKMLSGKLERRNVSIQTLQRDNEKLSMAQELSKESAEEFEELVTERDGLQSDLDNLRTDLGTATSEVNSKVAQVLELEGIITGLRSEQASSTALAEKQTQRVAELEASVAAQMAEIATALSAVDSHKLTIEGVEQALIVSAAESTDQLRLLILNILAQRQRLSHATDSWRRASNLLQYQTTALENAKVQVKTLTTQVDAFEAERSAMSLQFQSHTQRAKALDTANEKAHELESQVETLEAECAAMAEQLDVVAAREQALVKQTEEPSVTRRALEEATQRAEEAVKELSEAREEIARLESEISATQEALNATDAAHAQTTTNLTQELAEVKKQLAASEARASDSVDELKKLGSQIERLERLSGAEGDSMEDEAQSSQVDMSLVERSEVNVNHTVIMVDSLRQHVDSVEKRLHDEKAKSAELAVQSQALTARLAEAEEQARDAVSKEADLQALRDTVGEMTREVQVKTATASDLSTLCDTLRAQVGDLTVKLEQATESATDHTLALQGERATLQKQLETASEKADALRMEVSSTMTKNQLLNSEVTSLTNDLQAVKTSLANTEKTVEDMTVDMEKSEKEKEKTVGLLKYQETETMSRTNKVQSLERELQSCKAELGAFKQALAERTTESAKLEAECAELRSALVEAQASGGTKDDSEFLERIAELEASLMIKTQEVDEADDRTREAFKAKAKVDKKVAKLTRQLGDKELEMNTKRNKVIAMPDPTPINKPVLSQMAPPFSTTPLTQQRAPLRSVDNLEPAAHIVSTPGSLKRLREGDEDQKPLPAEAIMLPPSAPSSISKTPNRRSFTPKRTTSGGAENADMKSGARNIFGSSAGPRPNIFAPGE